MQESKRWLRPWDLISGNHRGDILKLKAPGKTTMSNAREDFGNISEEINDPASHTEKRAFDLKHNS